MPLVYQQNINEHTRLGVWHINESESFFLEKVPLQKSITHPHKRLQHLAGRLLLCEMFDDFPINLIQIAQTRKPFLEDDAFHFSISHCGHYAAAIVSRKNRVGVDVETIQPKIELIKDKFLTAQEQQLLLHQQDNPLQALTMAWSAKEALFKWYALGNVDFKKNLQIATVQIHSHQYAFDCRFVKEHSIHLQVRGFVFNQLCLSWVVS